MKKLILTASTILCLSFLVLAVKYTLPVSAQAGTINVPADYVTIQEAINHANPGDTINVSEGIYYENIAANKTLSLIGRGPSLTIVDGRGLASVITITADGVTIYGFTLRNSGPGAYNNGITVDRSDGNNITNNRIAENKNGGIVLSFSRDNVVSNNDICLNTYAGINLYRSSSNVISGNSVYLNGFSGIDMYSSDNNVIMNNAIYANDYYGIYLSLSVSNTIYHNSIENVDQAVGNYLSNFWDYGGEGNYWSDYMGSDLFQGIFQNETGSDGVGEVEYVIDENNKDYYPLMGRFYPFTVTLKKETYQVNVISTAKISDFSLEYGEETGNKIIHFNTGDQQGSGGFCRVDLPSRLVSGPFIVLIDLEEVSPNVNGLPEGAGSYVYFTYANNYKEITIISSRTLLLYYQLIDQSMKVLIDLNATYREVLGQYDALLGNYSQLRTSYQELDSSYQEHLLSDSEKASNVRSLTYIITATTAVLIAITVYLSRSTPTPPKG